MRATSVIKLLTNAAAGTTGTAISDMGGKYLATCTGTSLDSSHTATVQIQDSAGNWIPVYSFTAAGATVLDLPPSAYRGVTTASTPTATYLELSRVPLD